MALKDQIMNDMKSAMKAGNREARDTLRFLQSEIKNVEIDEGELDDEGIQGVIRSQIKQMRDAIQDYKNADAMERVEEELAKIEVLEQYLPEQLSDEELDELVASVKKKTGETEMGKLIGQVVVAAKGRAEGSRVAEAVRRHLN